MSLNSRSGRNPSFLWVALLSFAALAAALIMQHAFDIQPCAWCALLRLIFVVLGVVGFVGWALQRSPAARWTCAVLTLALSAAGIAAGLYLHFVAALSSSCAFSLADRILTKLGLDQALPEVFKVTAACDAAIAPLLGVPSALWAVGLFVVAIVCTLFALRR